MPLGRAAGDSNVVHATSMAGPFAGGRPTRCTRSRCTTCCGATTRHLDTRRAVRFHERRLKLIAERRGAPCHRDLPGTRRTSRRTRHRASRVHAVRLGVDDDVGERRDRDDRCTSCSTSHGVRRSLHPVRRDAETAEEHRATRSRRTCRRGRPRPRTRRPGTGRPKRLGRSGHRRRESARAWFHARCSTGLYRDATVVAYVPLAEGWGLPPVEALHAGTRVVASATTPSVATTQSVVRVDPLDVERIAEGLLAALALGRRRREQRARRQARSPTSRGATSRSTTWRRGSEGRARRVGGAAATRRRRSLHRRTRSTAPGDRRRDDARHASRRHAALARLVAVRRTSRRSCRTPERRDSSTRRGSLGTSATARSQRTSGTRRTTRCRIAAPTPTVVTIHDLTFFTNPEWHERSKVPFFRRAITYAAAHADVLISVSEFTARELDETCPPRSAGRRHRSASTSSASPETRATTLTVRAHALHPDVPYIFFLGTFEPRKGLDVLLDAFEEIAESDGDDRTLVGRSDGLGREGDRGADCRTRRPRRGSVAWVSSTKRAARVASSARGGGVSLEGRGFRPARPRGPGLRRLVVTTATRSWPRSPRERRCSPTRATPRELAARTDHRSRDERRQRARARERARARAETVLVGRRRSRNTSRRTNGGGKSMKALVTGGEGFVGRHLLATWRQCGDDASASTASATSRTPSVRAGCTTCDPTRSITSRR